LSDDWTKGRQTFSIEDYGRNAGTSLLMGEKKKFAIQLTKFQNMKHDLFCIDDKTGR
jgi:hypothetical protein